MADPQRHQQVNMEDSGQEQLPVMGAVQLPYMTAPYPANQMMNTSTPMLGSQLPAPTSQLQHQLPYQQVHQQQQQHHLGQQLQMFWANQYQEIIGTKDFKNHSLPLARIKKIMKADEDVRMIAAEAPMLFAKACEMFILELTYRSWALAEENKRRTLLKNDIAGAITRTNAFDFLVDIVPKEELKDEVHTVSRVGGLDDSLSYYYVPPNVGSLGMMMGKPDVDHGFSYNQQPQTYMSPQQICHQQQSMQEHPEDDQS